MTRQPGFKSAAAAKTEIRTEVEGNGKEAHNQQ